MQHRGDQDCKALSLNDRMVWVGRDREDRLVPTPAMGRDISCQTRLLKVNSPVQNHPNSTALHCLLQLEDNWKKQLDYLPVTNAEDQEESESQFCSFCLSSDAAPVQDRTLCPEGKFPKKVAPFKSQ